MLSTHSIYDAILSKIRPMLKVRLSELICVWARNELWMEGLALFLLFYCLNFLEPMSWSRWQLLVVLSSFIIGGCLNWIRIEITELSLGLTVANSILRMWCHIAFLLPIALNRFKLFFESDAWYCRWWNGSVKNFVESNLILICQLKMEVVLRYVRGLWLQIY